MYISSCCRFMYVFDKFEDFEHLRLDSMIKIAAEKTKLKDIYVPSVD